MEVTFVIPENTEFFTEVTSLARNSTEEIVEIPVVFTFRLPVSSSSPDTGLNVSNKVSSKRTRYLNLY
jgi:hypothetical protein